MDKLSVMHAFRRIVERGSFARAAEDLGVSPALLSREIKLLEESLGTTLLTRTTRSMSLTDAGRLYYDEATGILDAVVGVETRIRDGAGAVRGHLKVNASSSFGQTVIAPILPSFLDAYPDLHLTVSMDDRVVDMVEGGFDVSIRIRTAMPDSALVARKVGTMRQRIFAAPAYLERTGVPVVPQEIARHHPAGGVRDVAAGARVLVADQGFVESVQPVLRHGAGPRGLSRRRRGTRSRRASAPTATRAARPPRRSRRRARAPAGRR